MSVIDLQKAADAASAASKANPTDAALHAAMVKAQRDLLRGQNALAATEAEAAAAERKKKIASELATALPALDAKVKAIADAVPALFEQAFALYPDLVDMNDRRGEVGLDPVTEERLFAPIFVAIAERFPDRATEIARFLSPPGVYSLRVNATTGRMPNVIAVLGELAAAMMKAPLNDAATAAQVKARMQVHATSTTRAESEATLEALSPPAPLAAPVAVRPPGLFRKLFADSAMPLAERGDDDGPSAA